MKHWNWLAIAAITMLVGLPIVIILFRNGHEDAGWVITSIMIYTSARAAQQKPDKEKP